MVSTGECERGIVPLRNSIEGIVTVTFDTLFGSNLPIRDELVLDIHHTLAGIEAPETPADIKRIYSHPQALAQCRRYFERHYPEAEIVTTASTAAGMETIAEAQDATSLAVGPDSAVDIYGLSRVDQEIEDDAGNQTLFVAFSRDGKIEEEQDFIMIAVVPEEDRSGLIHDVTGVFKEHDVNLSELHSRPRRSESGSELGSHMFYMRLDMRSKDPRYEAMVAAIKAQGNQVVRMSA